MTAALQPMVLNVADVAVMMRCTPKAVYHAVARGEDWLPPPMRRGRRLVWYRQDLENHVKALARSARISR